MLANLDAVHMFNISAVAMLAKLPARLASSDGFDTPSSADDPPLPFTPLTNGEPGVVGVGGCVFDPPNGE